ncbi:MAG: DUF502 domain-containing protein [Microcystaceae cyanobacterium]
MSNEEQRSSNLAKLIGTTFIGGFLVVMPAYLAILAFNKMITGLIGLAVILLKPITTVLGIDNNAIAIPVALVLFLVTCLIAGLLLKTSYSRLIKRSVEPILMKIPGYLLIRSIVRRVARLETTDKLEVAFVALGNNSESLSPAFLIEKHENEMHTVFVPTVPTPTVGNLYVVPDHRIFPVDVPLLDMVKFISKWGETSPQLGQSIKQLSTDSSNSLSS